MMAWPDNLDDVECVGFPPEALPYLITAIEDGRVEWGHTSMFAESGVAEFIYMGFQYRLHEFSELVTRVEKIARIDVDDDGAPVVVENYETARRRESYGAWGDF